jgi:hypothetical protein
VASPGDVQLERELVAGALAELNQTVGASNNLVLELVAWEKSARPEMGRIQAVINHQIGEYDIFVGIMWRRFGTPSGTSGSGTEEEFRRAYASWHKSKRPNILLYFSEAVAPPPRTVAEAQQQLKVAEFREEVEGKGLTWSYSKPESFDDVVRQHLYQLLLDEYCSRPKLKAVEKPLDPKLKSLLEIEKNICREQNVSYLTSHLLLRMIEIPGSLAKKSFEKVRPGVCAVLQERIGGFLDHHAESGSSRFSDFVWEERSEVRAAQDFANADGSFCIEEKHLLLSLLGSESKTITKLKESVFPGECYDQVLAHISGETKQETKDCGTQEVPVFDFTHDAHLDDS